MGNERFPRRTDLAIWFATLAFLGLAIQEAAAAAPAATTPAATAPQAKAGPANPRDVFQRECGDCHIAYAPRLLPAADWRRIVGTLDRHFGVDASLDAATSASIAAWLEANAGRARSGGVREEGEEGEHGRERERDRAVTPPLARAMSTAAAPAAQPQSPLPRISTTAWFSREHDEIAASTWKRPAIGSAARCEACHTDAAQGRFSERAIRIPR